MPADKPSNGRVEAQLAATRAELDRSEAKYRRLFEDIPDAVCIGTVDGRLLDVNPAAVELFGYPSRDALLAVDIARDLYWNPEDRRRTHRLFIGRGSLDGLEIDLKRADGKRLRVRETATAIRDDDGEIVGFCGILRDVTEQRRLEEQLRQSQKMEAVGRLASGVAHDFNNLLTTITGYSELVLARMEPGDAQRRAVDEIRKAGRRAADLTRRLLTLSHHRTVAPRRIELNRIVDDMEKLLRRVLGADVELITRLTGAASAIHADQGQIEQLILNLAVNSRDAMPDGGRLEIETEAHAAPNGLPVVSLVVRDSGAGMPRTVREHAFEPFFTTKGRGHNTGLGLAIVYGIVQQWCGEILVDSDEGEGTCFHITFPAAEDVEAPSAEATEDPALALPRGDEIVLLAEDETSVRTLVRQILEMQGYRVLAARDADAATALCADLDRPPDLLLTDVVMPGRSGISLAEEMHRRYPELRFLFMSGYTDTHLGVKMLAEKQFAFLPKPFSPETLASKVRQVLDGTASTTRF